MSAFVFLSFVGLFTFFTFRPPLAPTPAPAPPEEHVRVAPANEGGAPPPAEKNVPTEVSVPQLSEKVPVVNPPVVPPAPEVPSPTPTESSPIEDGGTSSSPEAEIAHSEATPPPLPPETIPDPVLVLDEGETQGKNEEHTEPQPDVVQLLQEQAAP